ncbi:hypothetical protein B0T26DRAFT_742101 [Lasiosphaeria miniovina]|uniref:NmrA-like domain-containing protein n=1 Tax=Lasiosphaeria miniovina TaxID=1954250 RepID=A0AA40ACK0_9PEZI|nr:uncharacterized protein B0T26DRAFT_742101 [Lasiosphaeria miniovina]KAK0713355.1 hypothetical protein B0T26DRAFT_742101 [Lasiosphaeria miniovina]
MVKIAIAGGSGEVAREVIDALVATKKHHIIVLSRQEPGPGDTIEGTSWATVDFTNKDSIVPALKGVHTVLNFVPVYRDSDNAAQRTLIDAVVEAGVGRFAPSEWATLTTDTLPWYGPKVAIREYLAELNKDGKVLEYCLFSCGVFTNYLGAPYPSTTHVHTSNLQFDLARRRAILVDGGEGGQMSFTTVSDFANVVARAVKYEGEWPVVGGIRGDTVTAAQLVTMAEEIRGGQQSRPNYRLPSTY